MRLQKNERFESLQDIYEAFPLWIENSEINYIVKNKHLYILAKTLLLIQCSCTLLYHELCQCIFNKKIHLICFILKSSKLSWKSFSSGSSLFPLNNVNSVIYPSSFALDVLKDSDSLMEDHAWRP